MSKMKHAKLKLPTPQVHPKHPLRNPRNHAALLDYVTCRLESDNEFRGNRVSRYSQIDRDIAGFLIRTTQAERDREAAKKSNGQPVALESHLPLTFIHMDDMMTYFAQTFAPNRGMFYQMAKPEQSSVAATLVSLFNYHATHSGYYRQLLLAMWSVLKYNMGGLALEWVQESGPRLTTSEGQTVVEQVTVFTGNRVQGLDMYNTMWDSSVSPADLHKDGEWVATARRRSHYWLKSRVLKGVFANCTDILEAGEADDSAFCKAVSKYYVHPPTESKLSKMLEKGCGTSAGGTDWMSILGSGESLDEGQYEVVTMHIRLNPNDFGLIDGDAEARAQRNGYEIWRVSLLNGERIIAADHINNVHQHLPVYFGILNEDTMGADSKSPAETIQPLADFASFMMNTHVKAVRKNLYGTTYYDPSVVDMSLIPDGEVAARIPVKAQGYGKDVRAAVHNEAKTLDTQQTLQDMQGVMALINQFFPTQAAPSQIAGIDRAISSQVAAVQQGVNRRQHKGARLLDDTLMRPLRVGMYYNVVQYQEDGQEVPDYYGSPTKVDLSQLRDTNLSTVIGMGLMAIDRQSTMDLVQKIIFTLIQNPEASRQIEIMGMLDYWVQLMDVDMNLAQFKKSPEVLAQEQAAMAGATAEPEGVTPMNNPMNSGVPIFGGDPGL